MGLGFWLVRRAGCIRQLWLAIFKQVFGDRVSDFELLNACICTYVENT